MTEAMTSRTGLFSSIYRIGHRFAADHQRLVKFILVGMVNTVFGYSVFAILFLITDLHNVSVIAATIIGIIFNFFTTGRIVFGNKSLRALLPFVLAYGVALGLNLLVLNGLLWAGVPVLLGQALSLPVVVIVSYLINARFVFHNSRRSPRTDG